MSIHPPRVAACAGYYSLVEIVTTLPGALARVMTCACRPTPSCAAFRSAAALRLRLPRTDEGAGELVFDPRRQSIDVHAAFRQVCARIVEFVDAPWLDLDVHEAGGGEP